MTLKQSDISHVIVSGSPHSVQSGGFRLQLSGQNWIWHCREKELVQVCILELTTEVCCCDVWIKVQAVQFSRQQVDGFLCRYWNSNPGGYALKEIKNRNIFTIPCSLASWLLAWAVAPHLLHMFTLANILQMLHVFYISTCALAFVGFFLDSLWSPTENRGDSQSAKAASVLLLDLFMIWGFFWFFFWFTWWRFVLELTATGCHRQVLFMWSHSLYLSRH